MTTPRWTETPDHFQGDMAIGPLYGDRPPTRGIAGWTDWCLGEPLAAALLAGRVKAVAGEKLLIAGRPPLGVGKVLLVGCKSPATDPTAAQAIAERFADAMEGLSARRILVEVPFQDVEFFITKFRTRLGAGAPKEIFAYLPEVPCRI